MKKNLNITIADFHKIARAECNAHNAKAHEDDQIPYTDWLEDLRATYSERYGIEFDRENGNCRYLKSNQNWQGDDVCPVCDCYFNSETMSSELCPDCLEEC